MDRLRRAFDRIKSKYCKDWFDAAVRALGNPDLSVESTRPKTLDKLLEYAEFNKYDPKLTAQDMRISENRRKEISYRYESTWRLYYGTANGVTLGPDYTRIYLMPTAFWNNTTAGLRDRDLSGIITFELFHVAGFGDDAINKLRDDLQQHCGISSDLL